MKYPIRYQRWRAGYFFFCSLDFCFMNRTPQAMVFANQPFLGKSTSQSLLRFSLNQSHSFTELSWISNTTQTEKGALIGKQWMKDKSRANETAYFLSILFVLFSYTILFILLFLNLFIPILCNSQSEKFSVILQNLISNLFYTNSQLFPP